MKNQYFGDVGDFGKYGLLTEFSSGPLKLGVNWYLTINDSKNDGNHIAYFEKPQFVNCDHELHGFLKDSIMENRRNVNEIKKLYRFNDVEFYDQLINVDDIPALSESGRRARKERRDQWFMSSLESLSECDLIFCDPDNGIETRSLSPAGKDSVKYILISEINKMIENRFSLVIYNHRDRSPDSEYKSRIMEIYNNVSEKTEIRVLRFNRYSVRDYIVLMQHKHAGVIGLQIDSFLSTLWSRHFNEIII